MNSPALRSITRNTGYIVSAHAINLVNRIVWVVIAARMLGPDLYALLAYCLTWQMAFLPLAIFGVGPVMSYLIGPDRTRASEYAAPALSIRILTIVLAVVACVSLSRVIAPDPRAPALIAVLALVLAARALTMFAHTLFTAFEVNQYTLRQGSLFGLLDLAVALVILLSGGSLLMLVAAKAVVAWIQAPWALAIAHRQVVPIRLAWQMASWRPILKLVMPALMITLAVDWRFNGSLILFRNLTTDGILFGQYALAMQALAIAAILPLALSRAAFPALRRAVARGDGKDLLFASAVQRAAPIIGTLAGLLGWTFGEPVFRWLLGEPFSKAGELVGLTLWCLIPMAAMAGYPEILLARGRFRAMVVLTVSGAAVMTFLTILLVPVFGVEGAILAALLGFSVPPAAAFVLIWQDQLADPVTEVIRPFVAAGLSICVTLALASLSRWGALAGGIMTLVAATYALRIVRPADIVAVRAGLPSDL